MSDNSYLYLLLMGKIFMIVHLAGNECVCAEPYCIRQEKRTGTAAYCHLAYRTAQQLVTLHAFHIESLLQHHDEIVCRHRLGKLSHRAASTLDALHLLFGKEPYVLQVHLLGNLEVDATLRIVHIGMHGKYSDVILYRFCHSPLHIVGIGKTL